jgi:hypothetical protein
MEYEKNFIKRKRGKKGKEKGIVLFREYLYA